MSLFEEGEPAGESAGNADAPLPVRMRPVTPEEFVGQDHFFAPGRLLRRMLDADRLSSIVFYGPPGTGKTTLAHIIANVTRSRFHQLNAALSGTADVKRILAAARRARSQKRRTVLFIDELHRFNKAQQDVLLGDVEDGTVILVGATTQNPFFALNAPLVSRSQIFEFKRLTPENVRTILKRALSDPDRGLGKRNIDIAGDVIDFLARAADGDARRALSALEVGVLSTPPDGDGPVHYDMAVAQDSIQRKAIHYDGRGDEHYDAASAFIKSMRGSDPDAALYWMAYMLEAGDDARFIARRIVICAAEDVGNADPMALVVAAAALEASEFVGLPEAQLPLAQAAIYVASAPKSNASCVAINEARKDVRQRRTLEVPDALKDASRGAKELGRGQDYKYAHNFPGHWVDQEYMPSQKRYYKPDGLGYEAKIKKRLEQWRKPAHGKSSESASGQ